MLRRPRSQRDGVKDLYRYVWRVSARDQVILSGLSIALFLLELAPLELQRRIVNTAVDHHAFKVIAGLSLLYITIRASPLLRRTC
jgi:hypothetical protein